MGVPGLFANLKNKYTHIIKNIYHNQNELDEIDLFEKLISNEFDIIFFDFNCIIHPITHLLYKTHGHLNKLDFEKIIMTETLKYVQNILNIVKIKNISAIFVDGVCPYAKMAQQRQRRFASIIDKELVNDIKKSEGVDIDDYYDTNSITPGTEFMENFHQYILNYIKIWNNDNTNPKMIYSSFHEYGEGEHKIINYIKNNSDELIDKKILIYGLDADLIILSLTLADRFNIKLLREKDAVSLTKLDIIIFDVNECAKSIMIEMSNDKNINNYNFVNDFIFITILLGNDFLPSNPTLNMKFHNKNKALKGYNLLIDTYKELYSIHNNCLVHWEKKKLEINWIFYTDLINKLADFEQSYFESTNNRYYNHLNKTGVELKIDMLNCLALFKISDPLKMYAKYINYDDRKKRFIHHYFGNKICECKDSNNKIFGSQLYNKHSNINDKYYENKTFTVNQDNYDIIINKYLKTIGFIMYYYYHGCPNNLYYYNHCSGILLSDLYEYLNKKIKMNANLNDLFAQFYCNKNKKILPIQQLLIVLPEKSFYLLPQNVIKTLNDCSKKNILVNYFKQEYLPDNKNIKRDYLNKTKLYQASLIIKIPKISLINAILSDIEVTNDEILRFI
jgi:5'-3' exoribonuclease 1